MLSHWLWAAWGKHGLGAGSHQSAKPLMRIWGHTSMAAMTSIPGHFLADSCRSSRNYICVTNTVNSQSHWKFLRSSKVRTLFLFPGVVAHLPDFLGVVYGRSFCVFVEPSNTPSNSREEEELEAPYFFFICQLIPGLTTSYSWKLCFIFTGKRHPLCYKGYKIITYDL